MAVGQQGGAEAWSDADDAAVFRSRRPRDGAARRAPGGPAFISDEAEEQHHFDTLRDPSSNVAARASARIELARLYQSRGQYSEAAEMYERNVWAGARTPATYAGLAAMYRALGRDDLAESTLEQVRRTGGVEGADPPDAESRGEASRGRRATTRAAAISPARSAPSTRRARPGSSPRQTSASGRRADTTSPWAAGLSAAVVGAAFLGAQAGRRTLIASTVLIPIVLGLAIFAVVVMTSTRPRANEAAQPQPATPAPVATVVPTPAPTSAVPPALQAQPAPARLVVSGVGTGGLSLRKSPGNGDRIKVWPEDTQMSDLGEQQDVAGKAWKRVRDPEGNVGWAATEFLSSPVDPAARTGSGTPAAQPSPPKPPFNSGGLGLSKEQWEQVAGQPTRNSIFTEYAGGRLVVGFMDGNVWHLERVWRPGEAVELEAARAEARPYLPADATLVQSVDRGDGRIIDVYASTSLSSRYTTTAWNSGKPGTFAIHYRFKGPTDRRVTSAMYRVGDALY